MKTKNILIAILSLAGATSVVSSAHAQSGQEGDLLLGFRDRGASSDILVDLGPVSNFIGQANGFTETLPVALGTDLGSVFTNWATDGNLYWGAAATDTSFDLFATKAEVSPGTPAVYNGYTRFSPGTQSTTGNYIKTVGNDINVNAETATSDSVTNEQIFEQSTSSNSNGNWNSYMVGGGNSNGTTAFKTYSTLEANSTSGISSTALDLFYDAPSFSGGAGAYEGTFTIDNSGDVSFSVIPEPSTVATMILGAGILMVVAVRRRRVAQA